MLIEMTGHSVCGFDTTNNREELLAKASCGTLRLKGVRRVHDEYYYSPGLVLLLNGQQIGWVSKPRFDQTCSQLKAEGFQVDVATDIPVYVVGTYTQNTGKVGLVVDTDLTYKPPPPTVAPSGYKIPPTPENGATPVNKLPTLQQVIDANMAGLSTAAQLETGHVANLQLTKIVGKRLPKQYELVLKTPFGHLLMANAVSIAAQALYPQNALLKKVSNAMVVDSYQELLKMVDVPGIIDELLNNKEVLSAHAKDEAEKD